MPDTTPAPSATLRTVLLIIGSLLIVGVIGYLVVTSIAVANRTDASRDIVIDDTFDAVDVTAEVTDVTIEFGAVDETTLTFAQNDDRRDMTFTADVVGSTLTVSVIDHGVGWWMPFDFNDSPRLRITLPASLEGLDLAMDSDVGDVALSGDFADVKFTGTVGDLRLAGSAMRAEFETTVGNLDASDYSVDGELVIRSSTGDVRLDLGVVPASLDVTSNVGDQEITVPPGSYRVVTSTNVGEIDVQVDDDSNASTVLRLETTVGNITVQN